MKKRYLSLIPWALITVVFDRSLSWAIPGLGFAVCFALISAICASFLFPLKHALPIGVGIGLLIDLQAPLIFGSYMGAIVLVIGLSTLLRDTWFKQSSFLAFCVISLISLSSAYVALYVIHALAFSTGWLNYQPLANISPLVLSVGVVAQVISSALILQFITIYHDV